MNLIDSTGKPAWGRLPGLPDRINWEDYDARTVMGRQRADWIKPFLFKHFDFYGAVSEHFTFGCGLVRLGLINSLFAYLHTPEGLHQTQFDLPFDWGYESDYKPLGCTRWSHPAKRHLHAQSTRTSTSRQLEFNLGKGFQGLIRLDCSSSATLALNTPIANTGFAYAQKTSGCPVSGAIQLRGKTYQFNSDKDGCYHDWTAGYLRRETFWNWACASGNLGPDGVRVSLNLARGVNETSAHENVLWIDGVLHDLPLVLFDYDRDGVNLPWRVYSQCGAVNLRFFPEGRFHDHRQALVLASRFNQCFGRFEGSVRLPGTQAEYCLSGLRGWCEDHYAKW